MSKCIDFETGTEKLVSDYFKKSTDNVALCVESSDKSKRYYMCGKRTQIAANNRSIIYNNEKTYFLTYDNMYVCPMDKATLQNDKYCFFKFEFLRPHSSTQNIYNVKKYTLADWKKIGYV